MNFTLRMMLYAVITLIIIVGVLTNNDDDSSLKWNKNTNKSNELILKGDKYIIKDVRVEWKTK